MRNSSTITTTAVTPLITKNTAPQPTKRRMALMSVVARESS